MRKTLFAVLLIGLVATGIAAAQGSDQAKEQALSKLEAPDVLAAPATEAAQPKEAAPEQPAEKIVKLIEIVGNKSISSKTIISKIKTRTGINICIGENPDRQIVLNIYRKWIV